MLVNTVVIPVIRDEFGALEEWIKDCPDPGMNVNIFLSIDNIWLESEKRLFLEVQKQSNLKSCSFGYIDCEIPASQSFYEKDKSVKSFDTTAYPFGKKSGPNIQFFTTLKKLASRQGNLSGVLLLETDAHPIKRHWVLELAQRVQWLGEDVYVAGSKPVVASTSGLVKQHLNGNAIYHVGKSDFFAFLAFWEKLLVESVKFTPDLAYDVVLEWSYHAAKVVRDLVEISSMWRSEEARNYRKGLVDISDYISNISGVGCLEEAERYLDSCSKNNPQLIILHGRYLNMSGEDIVLNYKKARLAN